MNPIIFSVACCFQLFSITLTRSQAIESCPSDCTARPCPEAEDTHCEEWDPWGQCIQCADGYFHKHVGQACVKCEDIFGTACGSCGNNYGCNYCNCGTETHDEQCNLRYCADTDGDQLFSCDSDDIIDEDSTDEDSSTTDDDTSEDGDSGSSGGFSTSDGGGTYVKSSDLIETDAAIARFFNNDIKGAVVVLNGHVNISLDFSEFNFASELDEVDGEECFRGGMRFGIYNKWEHDDMVDKMLDDCDSEYTGARWDPWLACSMISSNIYCQSNDECVPYGGASNAYTVKSNEEPEYICNPTNYELNPFTCEMGDLSGKYGEITYDSENKKIETILSSPFEVDGFDLGSMSIVFRCHDNTRAFCAAFEEYDDITSDENNLGDREYQDTSINQVVSKRAYFGDNGDGYIYLSWFGKYEISVNSDQVTVPGICGDYIFYRIFDDSDCGGSQSENEHFYDPTVTCAFQSNQFSESSELCDYENSKSPDTSVGYRCNDDDNYEYDCDSTTYLNNGFYRYRCSPSDLSGKYGVIDISKNVVFDFETEGFDDLMIPLNLLAGKSVGFQCVDSMVVIACAAWQDYFDDEDYEPESDSSEDSGGKKSKNKSKSNKNKESTIMGMNATLFWVLLILFLLAIVPCSKYYQQRKLQENGMDRGQTAGPAARMANPIGNPNDTNKRKTHRSTPSRIGAGARLALTNVATSSMTQSNNEIIINDGNTYNNNSYNNNNRSPAQQNKLSIQQKAALARKNKTQTQLMTSVN